jgi:undecaprenyl-diphosphatase
MGLGLNLDREAAARFAFLLGTPAFIGAAIVESSDLASEWSGEGAEMAVGFLCSFLSGIAVIYYLLRFLRTRSLLTFVIYRWGLGVFTLLVALYRAG